MPLDPTIPLQVQQPTMQGALAPISSLLNIQQGIQGLQRGQQALQIGQQTIQSNAMANQTSQQGLKEMQGLAQLLQDPSQISDANGQIDWNKALPAVMKAAPTTGAKALQQLYATQQQSTQATQAIVGLDAETRNQVGTTLYSLVGQDPATIRNTMVGLKQAYPNLGPAVDFAMEHTIGPALQSGDGKQIDASLERAGRMVKSPPEQQQMLTPTPVGVSNNQQSAAVNVKPGAGVPVGSTIPGTGVQLQLPPTTPIVGGPGGTTPGYLGPQGQISAIQADAARNGISNYQVQLGGQGGGGFVPSGLPAGAPEARAGSIQVANQHWSDLNSQAQNSQLLEGVIGNIKSLAPDAFTGTESGKKAYVTGLLNALHLGTQATGDLQKDTDLLQKNMAQLNLGTPASTDAMRALVEAGRPHSTMSAGAITEAAAQLQGQIQANRAMRNALAVPKSIMDQTGDATIYNATRAQLEQVADPRAWQYEALPTRAAQQQFMAKLAPDDRAALVKKVQALESLGIIK